MALAIVFRPKSYGILNSFLFHYAIPRPTNGKGKRDDVELGMLELRKGVNFVESDVWELVSGHGKNPMVIAEMNQKGALSVYTPDAEEVVGSTTDFTNLSVVADILRHTTDKEWISRSISRDSRKEVFKLGSDRIREIDEDNAHRKQNALTLELV